MCLPLPPSKSSQVACGDPRIETRSGDLKFQGFERTVMSCAKLNPAVNVHMCSSSLYMPWSFYHMYSAGPVETEGNEVEILITG